MSIMYTHYENEPPTCFGFVMNNFEPKLRICNLTISSYRNRMKFRSLIETIEYNNLKIFHASTLYMYNNSLNFKSLDPI